MRWISLQGYGMTDYIYNSQGAAFGYIRSKYIHVMSGQAVGQLNGTNVHKLSGQYVGELHEQMILDKNMGNPGNSGNRGARNYGFPEVSQKLFGN